MGLSDLFVNVEETFTCNVTTLGTTEHCLPENGYGFFQLVFLMLCYGYILYFSSNLIADGSELLMLVLNPGLIGGLVLPVMGAIPDGAIVLFSGLGPDAQNSLKVGVGTLAGSTIMLLTVPWGMCSIMGRVNIVNGQAKYKGKPKLTNGWGLYNTGTQCTNEIPRNAKIMILTSLIYLFIQGPTFVYLNSDDPAKHEHGWALIGLILAVLSFIGYSVYQVKSAAALEQQAERLQATRRLAFRNKVVDLAFLATANLKITDVEMPLLQDANFRNILRRTFDKFDEDNSGAIDKGEFRAMMRDTGVKISKSECNKLFQDMDINADGEIGFDEYLEATQRWLKIAIENRGKNPAGARAAASEQKGSDIELTAAEALERGEQEQNEEEEDDEDEEEEEEEDETGGLTPGQIKFKAFGLMILGVAIVTIFSDPMVDVLSEMGNRLGVSPFYVSFVVTPLASNASEFISSMVFAQKKTKQSITLTYSALLGAATMNNTLCLGIFLALVYFKQLIWEFSAEVTAILFIEVIMMFVALNTVQKTYKAWLILALFPLSIVFVAFLESVVGWE